MVVVEFHPKGPRVVQFSGTATHACQKSQFSRISIVVVQSVASTTDTAPIDKAAISTTHLHVVHPSIVRINCCSRRTSEERVHVGGVRGSEA